MLSLCSCIIYRNLHFVKRKITKNYKINYKQVTLVPFLCFRFFSFPVSPAFRDICGNVFSLFCHFGYKVKWNLQDLPLRGRGTARRRWMRRGTAFRIVGTIGAEVETPKPSPSGKGDRRRRWMRGGTAFRIVGTIGAEVKTTVHVIPRERSESRNLPKRQVSSCVGSFSNVVDFSTPHSLRSE